MVDIASSRTSRDARPESLLAIPAAFPSEMPRFKRYVLD